MFGIKKNDDVRFYCGITGHQYNGSSPVGAWERAWICVKCGDVKDKLWN